MLTTHKLLLMKVEYGTQTCAFGGYYFLIDFFDKLGVDKVLESELPKLAAQSKYGWREIIYSLWAVPFCGGSALEDVNQILRFQFANNPILSIPDADRIGARLRQLSEGTKIVRARNGKVDHQFSWSDSLNRLLIKTMLLGNFDKQASHILDYDNTILACRKADAAKTYKRNVKGYMPGVASIDDQIVFVEQRNGNSEAKSAQLQTLNRLFSVLDESGIEPQQFRADSASYQWSIMYMLAKRNIHFYLRAVKKQGVKSKIAEIVNWNSVQIEGKTNAFRGTIEYGPSKKSCRELNIDSDFKARLVVTKWDSQSRQIDAFTKEACDYSVLITNDQELTNDDVVEFYNARGKSELHFKELKGDFGWSHLPFSELGQNYVYMIFMAICKNLYKYAIATFSEFHPLLKPNYHLKKFIFRLICTPAKWIRSSRQRVLRIFSQLRIYHKFQTVI